MIPFSPPRMDDKIINEVVDTLKSGWITTGPKTKLFEQRITEYTACKKTLCVSSASAGLELMLRWFGIKAGDEVIIPAYTYCATANVVEHCGAKPIMVDVDKDFNISIEAIKKAITKRTKVIIPVDIAGFPCDYNSLNKIVADKNVKKLFSAKNETQNQLGRILILSDAAHSLGARYREQMTGSLTDITVFSFHAVKNLTTAEGGAVCMNLPASFDHEVIYKGLCVKSLHGQSKDALSKTKKGNWKYDVLEPGYKFNMTDIQASMGLIELERYDDDMLIKRKHIFEQYANAFSKYEWAEIPPFASSEKTSSYHVFLIRIKGINEDTRNKIIQDIFDGDVSVNVHFTPLPMFTYYKNKGYKIENYPSAFDNYSRVISLPVFYDLSDSNIETVIEIVVKSVNNELATL